MENTMVLIPFNHMTQKVLFEHEAPSLYDIQ